MLFLCYYIGIGCYKEGTYLNHQKNDVYLNMMENSLQRISNHFHEMVKMMEEKMDFTYERYTAFERMKKELLEDMRALEFYIKGSAKSSQARK